MATPAVAQSAPNLNYPGAVYPDHAAARKGVTVMMDPMCQPSAESTVKMVSKTPLVSNSTVLKGQRNLLPTYLALSGDISVLRIDGPTASLPESIGPLPLLDLPVQTLVAPLGAVPERPAVMTPGNFELHALSKKDILTASEISQAEDFYAANYNNRDVRDLLVGIYHKQAKQRMSSGNLAEAIQLCRSALYIYPEADAITTLDLCLSKSGLDPKNIAARKVFANKARSAGDYVTAIGEYTAISKHEPSGANQAVLGATLLDAGQIVRGYNELGTALQRQDWSETDKSDLGKYHLRLADVLLEFAFKAKDSGRGSKGMARLANAWLEYKVALSFLPDDPEIRRKLLTVAETAVTIRPGATNYLCLASSNLLNGKKEDAAKNLERVRKLKPDIEGLDRAEQLVH